MGPWSPVNANPVCLLDSHRSAALCVVAANGYEVKGSLLLIRDCTKNQEKRERESKTENHAKRQFRCSHFQVC